MEQSSQQADSSTPSRLEQVIVYCKNVATALAINYVYNFLYLFLRKKHTVRDHPDPSTAAQDDEECDCGCVLNGCIDVFLKEFNSATSNNSVQICANRKFLLVCDPAASRERDQLVYDSQKKFVLRLTNMTNNNNKIKFRAFDRDYTIPVFVVAEKHSLVFSGLTSVDSILHELLMSSNLYSAQDLVTNIQLRTDLSNQFTGIVEQLVASDVQLNKSFLQLVNVPYSTEFKDVQSELKSIVTKIVNSPDNAIFYNQEDIKLDESSILHAQVVSLFYGFLNLISRQPEFSTQVKKYYLIFPRSGKVNAVESLSYLKRDRENKVVLEIARCGDNKRSYFIHAWKYNDGTTERQIYLETPSGLAMFEHMQDVVADKPNARIQSPECCNAIKKALRGLGPGESLSWKLADALQGYMNEVPEFKYQDFPVVKWDDINGEQLEIPQ